MKRLGLLLLPTLGVLAVVGAWIVFGVNPTNAVTNTDYSGTPPFVASAVTPNVLVMFDNSGTMGMRSFCGAPPGIGSNQNNATPYNGCPTNPAQYVDGSGAPISAPLPTGAPFVETVTFNGLFDPLSCYSYDNNSTNNRFVPTTTKAAINTACASTDWDGNLLNYITFRRHDALKKAFIGAQCVVARLADASCPPSGSPALITMKSDDGAFSTCCDDDSTFPMKRGSCVLALPATVSCADGRVPTAVQTSIGVAAGQSMVFHLRGSGTLDGSFCLNKSTNNPPANGASSCSTTPTGSSTGGKFVVHFTVSTEPTGVIHDLGDKARFGLLEFRSNVASNDGGIVLVPIGSTQGRPYNSTTVTTYTSNKAAMITGIEQAASAESTPLAETLYTGVSYFAQLPQPFHVGSYLYPCAFSGCGPAFGAAQTAGGLGPTESVSLVAGEPCPAGYQGASFSNCTAGRDPYFFSSANPAWATASKVVACCKSFIMLLTDGESNSDGALPPAIANAASATHGPTCSGSFNPIAPPPTAGAYLVGNGCWETDNPISPSILLEKHKIDYTSPVAQNHALDDVAYWAHVNDLRQATVPVLNVAGHDLPGFQNVTVYTVFAFGNINGRELLMQTAKQGGFDDGNANNIPDNGQTPAGPCVAGGPCEYDKVNNVTGLLGPDGIPDTYFEAQHGDEIKDKLLAAITSILQKSASGTSVSVLATSSTGEGAIYQAFFFPTTFVSIGSTTTQVTWTGFTQGLFLDTFGNLREDYSAAGCQGPPDGKLVLTHDCIIKVRLDPITNDVKVDRFVDANGDGIADSTIPTSTVSLKEVQPIWEGGKRLALLDPGASCAANTGGVSCRRLLTWLDVSNGGGVNSFSNSYGTFETGAPKTEFGEFTAATATKVAMLCPYLGGALVADCNSSVSANKTAALNEATGIINFIRGCDAGDISLAYCTQVAGLRSRQVSLTNDVGATVTKTWKLGDVMNSTPSVVGPPRERYDVIYGDSTYASFFQRYKDRRQVAYVGANDGMLHAFNAGFFTQGDDTSTTTVVEQVRFTTVPVLPGTSTTCAQLPCDASVTQYSYRANTPPLGAELWGFIPQDLLPHLRWLTSPNYDHTYYVDLPPKITDARIFAADADHPGGWGTILIGGFRLGGSCTNCTQGKSTPRAVTADFDGDGTTTSAGDTRVFLSSYFVLDVTNPEKDPTLLWVFRDKDLGLTTSEPAVLRVKPVNTVSDPKTNSTNEKWYVAFGTGPTHVDGGSSQTGKFFVVDLKQGPQYTTVNQTTGTVGGTPCTTLSPCITADTANVSKQVRVFSTGQAGSFMGDMATVDFDLDFRVEALYAGSTVCTGGTPSPCNGAGPQWTGALYRLTTNGGDPNPDTWGLSLAPTKLISKYAYTTPQATTCTGASPCKVGPILAPPTLSTDNDHNLWVFFGTGRFLSNADKTNADIQHYFGIKDCIPTGGCSDQTVERNNLYNSSNVTVCTSCANNQNVSYDGGATYTGGFSTGVSTLLNNVQNADGWFTTLPSAGERNLSTGTILGGTLFFTSFVPTSDICQASGNGFLYALYYQTGTAYTQSAIGESAVGSNTVANRSIALGAGLPSQLAIQLGARGSGADGTVSSSGCKSGLTGFIQASTGALGQLCGSTADTAWSRMIAWRDL